MHTVYMQCSWTYVIDNLGMVMGRIDTIIAVSGALILSEVGSTRPLFDMMNIDSKLRGVGAWVQS
jgi:hypothetical protein